MGLVGRGKVSLASWANGLLTWTHGRVVAGPLFAKRAVALRAVGRGDAEARATLPALATGA